MRPWEALAAGYDIRPAWRLDDPVVEADAIAFWNRLGILPSGVAPEERARELAAVAYQDGIVVGVHTVTLARLEAVRVRLAMLRTAVDPDHRRSHVSMALTLYTRDLLATWSIDHPEEKLAGLGAIIEGPNLFERAREPFWPQTRFGVIGYTDDGHQVRVSWFEHFRLDGDGPGNAYPPETPPFIPDDVVVRPAWRLEDARIEADAIAFWKRLDMLPKNVAPEARAKELVLGAYKDDRLVGVVTAELGILPQVRARLAMLRGAVVPEMRRSHVAFAMMFAAPRIIEDWAKAHPEERVAGIGGIIESQQLKAAQNLPYWQPFRYGLIGYTPDGRQIRVAWFEDFRLS